MAAVKLFVLQQTTICTSTIESENGYMEFCYGAYPTANFVNDGTPKRELS